jgi:hypothetical protein
LVDPRGKKKKEKVFGKEGGTNKKLIMQILVINL